MPYFMSDMAAGSDAVLQMQRNMAASQYVEQDAAIARQEQQAKLEQQKAITAHNQLANIIAESGIEVDKKKQTAITALQNSAGWGDKSAAEKATSMAETLMPIDPEAASKLLNQVGVYDYREAQTKDKQNAERREIIGKASAVLDALPDKQVAEYFDKFPPNIKKEIYDLMGEDNWNKLSPSQKKEVFHGLTQTAAQKLQSEKIDMEKYKADLRAELEREKASLRERIAMSSRIDAQDKAGDKSWPSIMGILERFQRNPAAIKQMERLDAAVEEAEAEAKKEPGWFRGFTPEGSSTKYKSETAFNNWQKALQKRNEYELSRLKEEKDLVSTIPDSHREVRSNYLKMLDQQIDSLEGPKQPAPSKDKEPASKPSAVPSNTALPSIKDLSSSEQSWVQRAMAANPEASEEEVVREGIKAGRISPKKKAGLESAAAPAERAGVYRGGR